MVHIEENLVSENLAIFRNVDTFKDIYFLLKCIYQHTNRLQEFIRYLNLSFRFTQTSAKICRRQHQVCAGDEKARIRISGASDETCIQQ